MVTLAEFNADVSAELRRGSSLDAQIPKRVRMALRWMEEQHTFRHQERYALIILNYLVTYPRVIALPTGFKKMNFWRIAKTDGGYRGLIEIAPGDQVAVEKAIPSGYWQDGMDYFWLDNTVDQNYNSEMSYSAYTVLPADTSQSPYVIQNFEAILFHKTCALMGTVMRDAGFIQAHNSELEIAMKSAVDADVEARQSNIDAQVQYGHEFAETIYSSGR